MPLILIPLLKMTGYAEVIEEISKVLIVLFFILNPVRNSISNGVKLPSYKMQIFVGIAFGLLFGLSESIFYMNNIFQLGNFGVFWQRLLWTVPMHIVTTLIILLPALVNKWLIILGLAGSIAVHLLFNNFVA